MTARRDRPIDIDRIDRNDKEVPVASEPTGENGLREVCRNAADLVSAARGPLRRITVRSGDISVELEWPEAADAPATGTGGVGGASSPPAEPAAGEDDAGLHVVRAGLVGTFYRAPGPDAPPFASEGDRVSAGQQVAILESMKLMTPVEADRDGVVAEFRAADGDGVEFGAPLVVLRPGA